MGSVEFHSGRDRLAPIPHPFRIPPAPFLSLFLHFPVTADIDHQLHWYTNWQSKRAGAPRCTPNKGGSKEWRIGDPLFSSLSLFDLLLFFSPGPEAPNTTGYPLRDLYE